MFLSSHGDSYCEVVIREFMILTSSFIVPHNMSHSGILSHDHILLFIPSLVCTVKNRSHLSKNKKITCDDFNAIE